MIEALLARASTRFVFVVGKGGVGKTTTAGALALALADTGHSTHLISTDPAHSIADLFQNRQCSPNLTLEEFDARKYAQKFFDELRAPFIELIERGTYLDDVDAAGFLDLSIPGIDEVMSALRLVELLEAGAERIIVDTAPTGHTVRLLETADIIDSWVNAGFAMADKASVVSAALVGQAVPLTAVPLLEAWRRSAQRFYTDVIGNSTAMVVIRSGTVVHAETERLKQRLQQRGMRVGATVSTGESAADFTVDRFVNPVGCDGVREWRDHVYQRGTARNGSEASELLVTAPAPAPSRSPSSKWISSLNAKWIWVAGKGGVGKSTVASAIAATLSQTRAVCIVSTDPAGSLSEVLGVEIGPNVRQVETKLFARQIDATSEFERMRETFRTSVYELFESVGLQEAAALDRRVIESLWNFAPPGIDEIIALIEIIDNAKDYDTVVIDSAPTGHFLRLIQMPDIALDWVRALMRLLVKYGTAGSLDALAQDLLAFAKRLKQLKLDLSNGGTTAVFVVTLDEPLVQAETARLLAALESARVPIAATILNRANAKRDVRDADARIVAPDCHREVIGADALRSFLAQWDVHGN